MGEMGFTKYTILCKNLFLIGACPALGDPANGMVTWTSLTTGGVATYECDPGFELVGQETRTCQSESEWSGEAPTCEPIRTCSIRVYVG